MRDIVLALIVFGALPYVVKRPYVGILLWVWLSVMNPHRMCYGFAYSFPFAAVVAGVTFLSMLLSKERKNLPLTPPVNVLLLFGAWMVLTTSVAFLPEASLDMLGKVSKIFLMTLVTIMLIRSKEQLHHLIYVLAASLAYFGVKGGVFTIRSAGNYRVWGPSGSFIEGNNEVALAFVVLIPILYYIMQTCRQRWMKWGMLASMVLCGLAALGSYSRGALVAISAMVVVL
ncbi:MAG: putative O-glycosylation ligase, exosortase A system-associated, partial [Telluria sp.]